MQAVLAVEEAFWERLLLCEKRDPSNSMSGTCHNETANAGMEVGAKPGLNSRWKDLKSCQRYVEALSGF